MKSKIFNTDQVRAIQEGRMTQFMQVVKPQPENAVMGGKPYKAFEAFHSNASPLGMTYKGCRYTPWPKCFIDCCCPFGKVGDIVYCRENVLEHGRYSFVTYPSGDGEEIWLSGRKYGYLADGNPQVAGRTLSAATMPREAARLFLRITNIRVMRVQQLTEADMIAQGITNRGILGYSAYGIDQSETAQEAFIYKEGKTMWDENKFQWIIDFAKTDKP